MIDAISHITVGVADLSNALALWIDRFGMQIVAEATGPDAGLAELWDLDAHRITAQALIETPGAGTGRLHLVEFDRPGPPVRRDAKPTDLGPKSIDVNCHDMPARYAELEAGGYRFRGPIAEYTAGDITAREAQMPGHDETNIVLIEVLSPGFEMRQSPAGYAAVTSFVIIVPDTAIESQFYADLFQLDELMHERISGPGIEKAVGLPQGTVLDLRLMGREGNFFGRVELISYEGLAGVDRFHLARPPALGSLHLSFRAPSIDDLVSRAAVAGIEFRRFERIETAFWSGPAVSLESPAGLRVEMFAG